MKELARTQLRTFTMVLALLGALGLLEPAQAHASVQHIQQAALQMQQGAAGWSLLYLLLGGGLFGAIVVFFVAKALHR